MPCRDGWLEDDDNDGWWWQNLLSHGYLLRRRGAARDKQHQLRDRQWDLPAASDAALDALRAHALLILDRGRGRGEGSIAEMGDVVVA